MLSGDYVFIIDGPLGTRIIDAATLAPLLVRMGAGGEVYTLTEINQLLTNLYTNEQINASLNNIYGNATINAKVIDIYTKTEVDNALGGVYTQTEISSKVQQAINSIPSVYTKTESDNRYGLKSDVESHANTLTSISNTLTTANTNASNAATTASTAATNAQTAANTASAAASMHDSQFIDGRFTCVTNGWAPIVQIDQLSSTAYGAFTLHISTGGGEAWAFDAIVEFVKNATYMGMKLRTLFEGSSRVFTAISFGTSGGYLRIGLKTGANGGNMPFRISTDRKALPSGNAIQLVAPVFSTSNEYIFKGSEASLEASKHTFDALVKDNRS
ncbi:MAG: hypothetical protein K2O54_03235 [Prevotella sp.]|nr:hypothetical protein [Prevotella sp.]